MRRRRGAADVMVGDAARRIAQAHDELVLARRQLRLALEHRAGLQGRQPAVCGTPSGYQRHKRAKEAPCWACIEAKTWDRNRKL